MTPNSMPLDALLDHVSNSDQDSLKEILDPSSTVTSVERGAWVRSA